MNQDDVNKMILDHLATLGEKQDAQNSTLIRLTVSVEEHVRRSNMHETEIKTLQEQLAPVKSYVDRVRWAGAMVLKILGVAGAVAALIKALA